MYIIFGYTYYVQSSIRNYQTQRVTICYKAVKLNKCHQKFYNKYTKIFRSTFSFFKISLVLALIFNQYLSEMVTQLDYMQGNIHLSIS